MADPAEDAVYSGPYHKFFADESKVVLDFPILILRMSMMFIPLKVFIPLAFFFGFLGLVKTVYDIFAVFFRSPIKGWEILLQPVFSNSAVFLLFVGLQLLILGMVADGVIRRISQFNRRLVPSHGYESNEVRVEEVSFGKDSQSMQDMN